MRSILFLGICSCYLLFMDNFIAPFIISPNLNLPLNNFPLTVCAINLLAAIQLPIAYACAATPPVVTPTPLQPPTQSPPVCCQPLLVSPTNNTNLSNGIMSFIYSSNTCRALAIATCSQPTVAPALQLMAGITVNQLNFINIQPATVSIPLVCNKLRQWETGEPPLVINTIQCILSAP
ncbi:putative integral membrane protein [Brugia pahangi]